MNTRSHAPIALGAATLLIAGAVGIVIAGDLDPPGGFVAPSMKTLEDVEPRTAINDDNTPGHATTVYAINDSGSYYLTENLMGESGKSGITINAYHVTIDLNGFELLGDEDSLDAIVVPISNAKSLTIINGTIRDWEGDGIDLSRSGDANGRIQNIIAHNNAGDGIIVDRRFTVADCVASANGEDGIDVGPDCVVTRCVAADNMLDGIRASLACIVESCTTAANGEDGIYAMSGSVVRGCSADGNTDDGIEVTSSLVIGNTATSNTININDTTSTLHNNHAP